MPAEITITFKEPIPELESSVKKAFPLNDEESLENIKAQTIFSGDNDLLELYFHGYKSPDAILLFHIVGREMKIHFEVTEERNIIASLIRKIESYFENIINSLEKQNIEVKKVKSEAIILSGESYVLAGERKGKWDHFSDKFLKNKWNYTITPVVVIILNVLASKKGWVDNIESPILGSISMILSLVLWCLFDYLFSPNKKAFEYEPISV